VTYSFHLVDDGFCFHKNSITLIYQDQRGSLFFLAVDQGIADPAAGPIPGSTPINVPSIDPTKAIKRFIGVRATENPISKF
jgi:hypothetical protein